MSFLKLFVNNILAVKISGSQFDCFVRSGVAKAMIFLFKLNIFSGLKIPVCSFKQFPDEAT